MHRDCFDYHRSNSTVSLASYVRQKRIALGIAVTSTCRVYLDQRFWILLRDVAIGRRKDSDLVQLLEYLRSRVEQGKLVCPISESVFIELLKQSDVSTRKATAQLIDDLSHGVTLIPHHERVAQELCNSFYSLSGATDIIPLQQLVWTKLPYLLGETHPTKTPFAPNEELVIQKAFFEHMWGISLGEMVSIIGDPPDTGADWQRLAANLNAQNRAHYSELRSFPHAFRVEFEGALSLFHDEMIQLVTELQERGYNDVGSSMRNLSDKKRFNTFAASIPTLHIGALCHAAVRWDQKRNLEDNDFIDFHHAEAAVGYCSVFLTEKPLHDLLSQNHLNIQETHECRIFWEADSALRFLQEQKG